MPAAELRRARLPLGGYRNMEKNEEEKEKEIIEPPRFVLSGSNASPWINV